MKKSLLKGMIVAIAMAFGAINSTVLFAAETADLVTLPDGVVAEAWTLEGQYYSTIGNYEFHEIQLQTQVAFDGADVYMQGLSYYFPEAWIKGSFDAETGLITLPNAQAVGVDSNGKTMYLIGSNNGSDINDIVFQYDAEQQMLTNVTAYVIETTDNSDALSNYSGFWLEIIYYAGEPIVPEPIVVPEDLETEPYEITGFNYNNTEYSADLQIGFEGRDVYFQGLASELDDSFWAKGTLSEDGTTVTIPANQYIGTYDYGFIAYDFFITAADDEDNLIDIVLNYDAEKGIFTTDQKLIINSHKFKLAEFYSYTNVVITKVNMNAATPADPEIYYFDGTDVSPNIQLDIFSTDVEGNELPEEDLYYTIWIEKDGVEQPLVFTAELYESDLQEDMVEIPYTFSGYEISAKGELVYLNQGIDELHTWTKIGVQTIYYEGEKVGKSNIVWMDLTEYWESVGIGTLVQNDEPRIIYDLQGRRATALTKGMYIVNGKKVMLK